MTALVVYDSTYGHTERIAQAIGETIGAQVRRVGAVSPAEAMGFDLLIVGSPTHGGWTTAEMLSFLKALTALKGANVAVFDTRTVKWSWIFGYAAPRMARILEGHGGHLVTRPEGFFVLGTRGPLKDGEVERAAGWAKAIAGAAQ